MAKPKKGFFVCFNPADPLEVPREIGRMHAFAKNGADTPERTELRLRLRSLAKHGSTSIVINHPEPQLEPTVRFDFECALRNLSEWIRVGGCYLRLCTHCDEPFISKDNRQTLCKSPSCQKVAARDRKRRSRSSKGEQRAAKRRKEETEKIEQTLARLKKTSRRSRHVN